MSDEASTSGRQHKAEEEQQKEDLYITHQVSKLDNLAGLAVKYHVTVADIKRANGLLSDTAMFAKDTLLIPTRSLSVGVEYSTWAGMIVTQFGRIPGDNARSLGFGGSSPPKQSASLDMLQRYYGTGDTASEPSDFRPGDPEGYESHYANGTEIEMSELDGLGGGSQRRSQEDSSSLSTVEYAGSRAAPGDERLRRRKAGELPGSDSPLRGSDSEDCGAGSSPERGNPPGFDPGRHNCGNSRQPSHHRRAQTQGQHLSRRESIIEKLKRVASQPALAIPQAASLSRIGEAVINPLADSLPPLPPGTKASRDRAAQLVSPRPRDKEARKAD